MKGHPHVSAAIKQLKLWVSAAALVVCLCAASRLLIFGFTHYTEVRWAQLETPRAPAALRVVKKDLAGTTDAANARLNRDHAPAAGAADNPAVAAKQGVDVNRVKTAEDRLMSTISGLTGAVGVVAAIVLALLTIMGVAVAGGASIPGVERVVTAGVWAVALAVICVPWAGVMEGVPLGGVFGSYDAMAEASDLVDRTGQGGAPLLARYVMLPAVAVGLSAFVLGWFSRGVEAGVIVTAVSQVDARIAQEVSEAGRRGGHHGAPRAVASMNHAIGSSPNLTGSLVRGVPEEPRPMGAPSAGEPLRRPV